MSTIPYSGSELELFRGAERWKRYVAAELGPFISGRVLEVGAGIGGSTPLLTAHSHDAWCCLDPDPGHVAHLRARAAAGELGSKAEVVQGVVADLPPARQFDTILYLDVLEHIEDDAAELACAASRLARGGHLVVLSPAHPWLFSPLDAHVGHHRRYRVDELRAHTPRGLEVVRARELDSVGVLASAANRLALRRALPTPGQIAVWDRLFVPLSRRLDPWLGYRLGKSVLVAWRS
jgi:SAM-dependent methyltransferase